MQSACGLKSPENIFVDLYADVPPAQSRAEPTAQAAASSSISLMGHVKEIAIGALAMLSLFMVSMMVRKGGPCRRRSLAGGGAGGAPSLDAVRRQYRRDDEIAGVVGEGRLRWTAWSSMMKR